MTEYPINEELRRIEALSSDCMSIHLETDNCVINLYSPWRLEREGDLIAGCLDDSPLRSLFGKKVLTLRVPDNLTASILFEDKEVLKVFACNSSSEFIEFFAGTKHVQFFANGDVHETR